MSWANAERRPLSLRGRLVLFAVLSSGILSLAGGALVLALSARHVFGRVAFVTDRLVADLRAEYDEFGGLTEAFTHCVEVDVAEHGGTFVVVCDADGDVLYATKAPDGVVAGVQAEVAQGRAAGRLAVGGEKDENGERLALRFRAVALADGRTVAVAHDVTEIERFLAVQAAALAVVAFLVTAFSGLLAFLVGGRILKLNDLVEEKDRAYAELRRLTDDIAHDLRTPLTRLSLAAEASAGGGAADAPLVRQVMSETEAMLELVNTMLDISQTETRLDRTPREEVDLAEVVRTACELYAPLAEDAGLTLTADVPEVPLTFSGHRGKIQRLLANLVENAVKYTPRGGRVAVALKSVKGGVALSVADTGCGIAAVDVPFVFRRFWRADASRHLPGNGLGLALVKAIATSYGGTVSCVSEEGKGSTFSVFLPAGG